MKKLFLMAGFVLLAASCSNESEERVIFHHTDS